MSQATRGGRVAALIAVGAVLLAVLGVDLVRQRPERLPEEGCIECHEPVALSPSHPEEFGCSPCHLGDPLYLDEERAHRGMVARPSEMAVVARTCGVEECHAEQVERVSSGLMATNAGIGAVLAFQFGEAADPDGGAAGALAGGIPALDPEQPAASLAEDHFRKFCATCHLHKALGDLPGEIGTRGGGCADCHLEMPDASLPERGQPGWAGDGGPDVHPRLTTRVATEECTKCHNRSARIGLTYAGRFEDEGYATPYHRGGPTRRELSGGRSWQPLLPDVHHEGDMACVDCHVGAEIMGDGEAHTHMEEQLVVACEDCHAPEFSGPLPDEPMEGSPAWEAFRSAQVNPSFDAGPGSQLATTGGGLLLPHVQLDGDTPVLVGRVDGERREIPPMDEASHHAIDGHERLSCQACHSAWTPQCYGCHEVYDRAGVQLDKVSWTETPGRWEERRSFLRFERPTLGIGPGETVQPFAPGCQVFLTERGEGGGAEVVEGRFPALAMAAFDPHATRTEVPGCAACHLDPKVLGLGDGTLRVDGDTVEVESAWDPERSGLDVAAPLDAFVDGQGRALQTTSRRGARPFDGEELRSILAVGACVVCHDQWDDPIWADWDGAVSRWRGDRGLPCARGEGGGGGGGGGGRGDVRGGARVAGGEVDGGEDCGSCHPAEKARLERSLHWTQAGVINVTRYLWGAQDRVSPPVATLQDLPAGPATALQTQHGPEDLVDDLLRRRCLRCHLMREGEGADDLQRPAGCRACHGDDPHPGRPAGSDACLRCHHGDATGADYVGLFQADDHREYRVPLSGGEDRPLVYGRDQHRLGADLHFEAGLGCTDCHGMTEVMGPAEGPSPSLAHEAVQVRCGSCHGGLDGATDGVPPSGLACDGDECRLALAAGGELAVPRLSTDHPAHDPAAHGRVTCAACHSAWAGQAFGYHLHRSEVPTWNLWETRSQQGDPELFSRVTEALEQADPATHTPHMTDRITGEEKPGIWAGGRTLRRWEEAALGVTADGRYAPLRPRHGFAVTSVGADGLVYLDSVVPTRGDGSGPGEASEPFTPHTTMRQGAACTRCHGNPRAAGLGIAATADGGPPHGATVPDTPATPGARLLTAEEQQRLLNPSDVQRRAQAELLLQLGFDLWL